MVRKMSSASPSDMLFAPSLAGASAASSALKDSHFYHTAINYNEHQLPVKVPLSTFPEEVGEVRKQNLWAD